MTTLSIALIWVAGTAPTTLAAGVALFARSARRRAEARMVIRLLRPRGERAHRTVVERGERPRRQSRIGVLRR
jgi:hypothetical protein